jgi:hypothetical protein
MAVLHNDAKNLRLFLELVDREVPASMPGGPAPDPGAPRVLGTAGVEFYDRRDKSFWPFLRLPVLYLGGSDGPELVASLRELCSLRSPGFGFRSGTQGELGFQIGRAEGNNAFLVEVGIDLAPYLLETSGLRGEPGRELAMFRFQTNTAELVKFADGLVGELDRLPPVRGTR